MLCAEAARKRARRTHMVAVERAPRCAQPMAGSGYKYLLRHTASGDVQRLAGTPLTAYYAASGYPTGPVAGRRIDRSGPLH